MRNARNQTFRWIEIAFIDQTWGLLFIACILFLWFLRFMGHEWMPKTLTVHTPVIFVLFFDFFSRCSHRKWIEKRPLQVRFPVDSGATEAKMCWSMENKSWHAFATWNNECLCLCLLCWINIVVAWLYRYYVLRYIRF